MKKEVTLVELMTVIVIMGILAAVAVPKFFSMICRGNLEHCAEVDPETYELVVEECLANPSGCSSKVMDVIRTKKQNTTPKNETVISHDTVYVTKADTVKIIDTVFVDMDYDACVKKCTSNNTSQSVINFCIKEECKETN